MRGAAPMIDVLSRIFKLKCAYLAVESYSGKGVEDEQGDLVFSREMSSIAPNMCGIKNRKANILFMIQITGIGSLSIKMLFKKVNLRILQQSY